MFNPHVPSVARVRGRIEVAPGVELAYTERGSGPPVVLLPGWTMSARC
jgi:pimeloyl-ACP methyl ester carboxylesterase